MLNVVITGASKGIGYAACKLFVRSNVNVIAISRDFEKLAELMADCRNVTSGGQFIPIAYDLANLVNTESAFLADRIKDHFEEIDILINNAGLLINESFENFKLDDAKAIFDTNFFAPAKLIKQLQPLMGQTGRAHVLNIGSMGGYQGSAKFPGLSFYSASKAALACLTECLAEEYKDKNIYFNCLALGATQTEMLAEAFPDYKAPLTAEQMAVFVAEFAMSGHRFFNGKVIPVSLSTP